MGSCPSGVYIQVREATENEQMGDFPGGPVAKTLCFHFRGYESHSWSGAKDPTWCAMRLKNKFKKILNKQMNMIMSGKDRGE